LSQIYNFNKKKVSLQGGLYLAETRFKCEEKILSTNENISLENS